MNIKIEFLEEPGACITKKICNEKSKEAKNSTKNGIIVTCGDVEIDKCPICLLMNPREYVLSCKECPTYICKSCFPWFRNHFKCPTCRRDDSVDEISFKETQMLKNCELYCSKCKISEKIEDKYSILKHKLQCNIENWKPFSFDGNPKELENLIDCLLKNISYLNVAKSGKISGEDKEKLKMISQTLKKETNMLWSVYLAILSDDSNMQNSLKLKNNNGLYLIFNCNYSSKTDFIIH